MSFWQTQLAAPLPAALAIAGHRKHQLAGLATGLKRKLKADDSLDVFGVHGLGGLLGALMTGVLADPAVAGVQGHLATQALASFAVLAYSLVVTAIVLWITSRITTLRVDPDEEQMGLDAALHAERLGH